jgi:hypothetical protein
VRGIWGLSLNGRTHGDVARWLTSLGHPTSVSDVKNSTREYAELTEGAVAAVPASLQLLRALVTEYPGLELARFFAPEDIATVQAYIAAVLPA